MKEDVHRKSDITEEIRRFRYLYKDVDQAVPKGAAFVCAISRRAEIVLARNSIGRPMFTPPTGERTLIAGRAGSSLIEGSYVQSSPERMGGRTS